MNDFILELKEKIKKLNRFSLKKGYLFTENNGIYVRIDDLFDLFDVIEKEDIIFTNNKKRVEK